MPGNDFSVVLDERTNIVTAPVYNPGPDPLLPILKLAGQGIQEFMANKEERKKQKKEAEAALAKDATNALFDGLVKINTEAATNPESPVRSVIRSFEQKAVESPAMNTAANMSRSDLATAVVSDAVDSGRVSQEDMDDLMNTAKTQASALSATQAAVAQGKLPKLSMEAQLDTLLQDIRSKYPGIDMTDIGAALETWGVKNSAFAQFQRETKARDDLANTKGEAYNEQLKKGIQIAGPLSARMSEADLWEMGAQATRTEVEMTLREQQLRINKSTMELSEAENKALAEKNAADLNGTLIQQANGMLAPILNNFRRLADSVGTPGSDPGLEEEFEETRLLMPSAIGNVVETVISKLAITDLDEANKMRTYLTGYVENTFGNYLKERDASTGRLRETMTDRLKLDFMGQFRFITGLKELGVDLGIADTYLKQLSPAAAGRIKSDLDKLSGFDFTSSFGRSAGMTHMLEVMEVLKGNKSLTDIDYDARSGAEVFSRGEDGKSIAFISKTLAKDIIAGDTTRSDYYLNTSSEMIVAAAALNKQSGAEALRNAQTTVTDDGKAFYALDKLIQGGDTDALNVGRGARATAAQLQMNLRSQGMKSGFWSIKYNKDRGKYDYVFDEKAWKSSANRDQILQGAAGIAMGGGPQLSLMRTAQRPPKPSDLNKLGIALNQGHAFLVQSYKWENNGLKATERELHDWYGRGITPASFKEEAKAEKAAKGSAGNVLKSLQEFNDDLRNNTLELAAPTIQGGGGSEVDAEGNVVMGGTAEAFAEEARRYRFSPAVVAGILANVQHESGFDPSIPGDGGTAHGFFQHRKGRVDNFIEVTGVHPNKANPAQAMKFFDWELRNPEKAGMTKEQAAAIRNADTPEEAAMLIQQHYERPKNVDPERGRTARGFSNTLARR